MQTEKDWFLRQEQDLGIDLVIRKKIKDSTLSSFSSKVFSDMKIELERFLFVSLQNLNDRSAILSKYSNLISRLTKISNSKVVKGLENLKSIDVKSPIVIVSNHFGIIPLTLIDNSDQRFPWPLKEIGAFPVRLASLNVLSGLSEMRLFEVATELPEPIASIQRATPLILIPRNIDNKSQLLVDKSKKVINENENVGIIIYPEGGISGKLNHGGPYDLDKFHTGAFVLAKELNLQILPVCQYFNPKSGFELDILKPLDNNYLNSANLNIISNNVQILMQKSLNNLQKNSILN